MIGMYSSVSNEDVAYTLNVSEETTFDFTLCSENTTYDTKLEIFTMNGDGCDSSNALSTGNYNDDAPWTNPCEFFLITFIFVRCIS